MVGAYSMGMTAEAAHGGGGGGGKPSKNITLALATNATSVDENAAPSVAVVVNRGGPIAKCTSTVDYATANGTATTARYGNTHGTLSFAANVAAGQINVPIVNDTTPEPSGTFTITLSNPRSGCKANPISITGSPTETVTITDSDVVITVPAGKAAVVHDLTLAGCDLLSATLVTPGGGIALGNSDGSCGGFGQGVVQWVNDTGSDATITVLLQDGTCSAGYYADTTGLDSSHAPTTVNHALVSVSGSTYHVDLNDAGSGCSGTSLYSVPAGTGTGNLSAVIEVGDPVGAASGSFLLAPGQTASVSGSMGACDVISVGWYDGTKTDEATNNALECGGRVDFSFSVSNPAESLGDMSFTLYLVDQTCTTTYYSDGSGDANHASASSSGSNTYVDINDAGGGGCGSSAVDNVPDLGTGALDATVFIG